MFKQGDKVRFLNEQGGGIIKAMLKKDIAVIETEDGFEYPYPLNQLVLADAKELDSRSGAAENKSFVHTESAIVSVSEADALEQIEDDRVYLFFEPDHEQDFLKSPLSLKIYNNCAFDVHLSYYKKEAGFLGGVGVFKIQKGTIFQIDKFKRSELDKLGQLSFQLLFFSTQLTDLIAPQSKTFRFKAAKFFKEHNYQRYEISYKPLFLMELANINGDMPLETGADFSSKKAIPASLKKQTKQGEELEVDLHIEELTSDYKGMQPAEMLAIQISHFRTKLEMAIGQKYSSVVFIHGVGNGILKHEIRKQLFNYDNLKVEDASYLKYGAGATLVKIPL